MGVAVGGARRRRQKSLEPAPLRMRLSLLLPEEAVPAIDARARAAGVTREEFALQAVLAACSDGPSGAPPLTEHERARMLEALRTVDETLPALTAERDALAARVSELEHLARVAAAEVAASQADRERMELEQDRVEDQRTRAKTRATLAAEERDRVRTELAAALDRAVTAERRASVAEAVAAERLERIADLREMISALPVGRPVPPSRVDGASSPDDSSSPV